MRTERSNFRQAEKKKKRERTREEEREQERGTYLMKSDDVKQGSDDGRENEVNDDLAHSKACCSKRACVFCVCLCVW